MRFLCPNCHTQTDTWCSKNKNLTVNCLNKEQIIKCYNETNSLTKLIRKLGLCDTQSNRMQIKNILIGFNLKLKENKVASINICSCGEEINKVSKTCIKCYNLIQRKIIRPSIEILLKEIKELGYSATGKKYGVSDNSIRKWVKNASMV